MPLIDKIPDATKPRNTAAYFTETVTDRVFSAFMTQSDPDMLLKSLGKSRKDLRALDTDDEITAAMDTRKDACLSAPWRLEQKPGKADDFILEEITTWLPEIISSSWNSLPFGYSVAELIYEMRQGVIGLSAVTEKPFEWFEPRADGALMWLTPYGTREEIDTEFKFLLARRTPSYRNPYGESLYSRLYWPWFFRHNIWRYWMRFLERFGDPLILGKTFDAQGMVSALKAMGINSAVAVQPDEDVKAILANGAGEFERVETVLAKRIQKSILGQTLTSDVQGGGSYAASQTHNEVRHEKRNSDLRTITPAVNQVIRALWNINGFSGVAPIFAFQEGAHIDKERADRDAVLANAGICGFTPEYLFRVYDFKEGDITPPITPITPVIPITPVNKTNSISKTFAALPDNLPENIISNNLATAADPVLTNWIDTIKDRVNSAHDLEQIRDTILSAYPDMDTAALAEVMMQQQMIARCVGMLEVQSEITGVSAPGEFTAKQPTTTNITLEQPAPVFNITLAEQKAPVINVHVPEQAQPIINNIMPDQPAPVVNVAAADVTIHVPEQPAPVVHFHAPEQQPQPDKKITIKRDANGEIISAQIKEVE